MGELINLAAARAELAGRKVWGQIETENPPRNIYDYDDLRAMADRLLASREKRFPALVAAGKMDAVEAEAELATFRAIAADWQWLCTGEGQAAPIATLGLRRAALDRSIATIAEIARDEGGFSPELAAQADAVIAMRWHLEPCAQTHVLAAITHEIRAALCANQSAQLRAQQEAPDVV